MSELPEDFVDVREVGATLIAGVATFWSVVCCVVSTIVLYLWIIR